jgi:hypothetical protein
MTVIPGVEHFFHGQLPLLKSLVTRHLKRLSGRQLGAALTSLVAHVGARFSAHGVKTFHDLPAMNLFLKILASWPLVFLVAFCAQAQMPQPPEVGGQSRILLIDVTANQVLAAKDPDVAVEPASLTKLMTAYLVFDALKSRKIEPSSKPCPCPSGPGKCPARACSSTPKCGCQSKT